MARASGKQLERAKIDVDPIGAVAEELAPYVPQIPLCRRLMESREQIVASGQPLLDWDELEREIAKRRGGTYLIDPS